MHQIHREKFKELHQIHSVTTLYALVLKKYVYNIFRFASLTQEVDRYANY